MPRAPKACGRDGCENRVRGVTYCDEHKAEKQRILRAQRGSTASRGYGGKHQRLRAKWKPLVAAGLVTCWRCGELIEPGECWDLGHDDVTRAYRGPEHDRRCNRSAGGRKSHRGPTPPRGAAS